MATTFLLVRKSYVQPTEILLTTLLVAQRESFYLKLEKAKLEAAKA